MSDTGVVETVLVTGATGRHGGTGTHVVRGLVDAGRKVRVLVRAPDERVKPLEELGAEIVIGDLHDRNSLVGALRGTDSAFFTYPINRGVIEAAASFASAALEVGTIKRVVVMSMGASSLQSPSHLGRAQAIAEDILGWAGLDTIVLRVAALFFENIETLHSGSIREEGLIRNNFGDAPVPWISGADAGALALAALLHPERFAGNTIHYPPGVEMRSHPEIAATLSKMLAKPVRYESIDTATWRDEIELIGRKRGGAVNADMARHISALGAMFSVPGRAPIRPPSADALEELTGQSPLTFDAYLAAFAHGLEPDSTGHHG